MEFGVLVFGNLGLWVSAWGFGFGVENLKANAWSATRRWTCRWTFN